MRQLSRYRVSHGRGLPEWPEIVGSDRDRIDNRLRPKQTDLVRSRFRPELEKWLPVVFQRSPYRGFTTMPARTFFKPRAFVAIYILGSA